MFDSQSYAQAVQLRAAERLIVHRQTLDDLDLSPSSDLPEPADAPLADAGGSDAPTQCEIATPMPIELRSTVSAGVVSVSCAGSSRDFVSIDLVATGQGIRAVVGEAQLRCGDTVHFEDWGALQGLPRGGYSLSARLSSPLEDLVHAVGAVVVGPTIELWVGTSQGVLRSDDQRLSALDLPAEDPIYHRTDYVISPELLAEGVQ